MNEYAAANVFGADFDPFLIRAAQMNMVMAGDGRGHLYHMNSLEFPLGHLADLPSAKKEIPLGSVDVMPPIRRSAPTSRSPTRTSWSSTSWPTSGNRTAKAASATPARPKGSVAPEILFIERCIQWLKPGGRMGIVLPDGILGNPAAEYIRWWIMRDTRVLASVDLPVESFIVEANVNILTSLLFLRAREKRKNAQRPWAASRSTRSSWPWPTRSASTAVATRSTSARRTARRSSSPEQHTERIRIGGRFVERTLTRSEKIEDNDLPVIAEKYREFLVEHDGRLSVKKKSVSRVKAQPSKKATA